jgi:hypothetical protein
MGRLLRAGTMLVCRLPMWGLHKRSCLACIVVLLVRHALDSQQQAASSSDVHAAAFRGERNLANRGSAASMGYLQILERVHATGV